MSRAVAAALATWLALGCGGFPPYEIPGERPAAAPLSRTEQPRTGELTWRPGRLVQTAEGVLFEFTLMNGTSRDYFSVMLRVVLRGPAHRLATVRWPAGALAARGERRVRAQRAPPGFEVQGADLELVYAQE